MSEPTANSSKGGTFPRNVQIGTFSEERLYGMISPSSGTFPRSAGPRAYANWNVLLRLERARLLRRSLTSFHFCWGGGILHRVAGPPRRLGFGWSEANNSWSSMGNTQFKYWYTYLHLHATHPMICHVGKPSCPSPSSGKVGTVL